MSALGIFSLLYGLIYVLLRLEDNALLVGAVASFLAVAAAMYFTRKIDWYSAFPGNGGASTLRPSAGIGKSYQRLTDSLAQSQRNTR